MSTQPTILADVVELAVSEQDGPPEWVQLLPAAGQPFASIDGRGPWQYQDANALIEASLSAGHVIVDVNHSTTRRTPKGEDAPAMGEVVEMEARSDGIWGRIAWNRQGRDLMGSRPFAYRGISPVLLCNKANPTEVVRIWHVSLTNVPALGGNIASLTMETTTMGMEKVAKALGLAEDAGEDAILAAISKLKDGGAPVDLTALAGVLGAEDGATVQELTVLARAVVANAGEADRVEELTAQVAELTADRFIERMIGEGYAIDAEFRQELTAIHAENPERAEKIVKRFPKVSQTHTRDTPPETGAEIAELTADQKTIAAALGQSEADFMASLNADATKGA